MLRKINDSIARTLKKTQDYAALEVLLQAGANINAADNQGKAPLHMLASYKFKPFSKIIDYVNLFKGYGAGFRLKTKPGTTKGSGEQTAFQLASTTYQAGGTSKDQISVELSSAIRGAFKPSGT